MTHHTPFGQSQPFSMSGHPVNATAYFGGILLTEDDEVHVAQVMVAITSSIQRFVENGALTAEASPHHLTDADFDHLPASATEMAVALRGLVAPPHYTSSTPGGMGFTITPPSADLLGSVIVVTVHS